MFRGIPGCPEGVPGLFLVFTDTLFEDIQREKFFSKGFCPKKLIVLCISLSMNRIVARELNNSGKGKNRTRRKLKLCFLSELLCLPYSNRPFYLNSFILKKVNITCYSWISSYPYPH